MSHLQNEVSASVQSMARFTALLYYHLTKSMVTHFGEEAAVPVISEAIRNFGLERGSIIREKADAAGYPPTIHNLDLFYDMPIAAGWNPHKVATSRTDTDSNPDFKHSRTEKCTFAELWKEKNWTKIGHLYCAVDNAIREAYNPEIDYQPQLNILLGDPCCESVSTMKEN